MNDSDDLRRYHYEYAEYCRVARWTPSPPSVLHLGAALPPEVLRNIINSVQSAEEILSELGWRAKDSDRPKKGFPALSLTCHDWARVIRPRLFHHLVLRIPEDVDRLLTFLESPASVGPELGTCIGQVQYKMKEDQLPPWIRLHKLSMIIPEARMHLEVTGIPEESLFKVFPRTLPPSIFPFHKIELCALHFKRANAFISLFNHNVEYSDLAYVTIEDEVPQIPLRRRQFQNPKGSTTYKSSDVKVGADCFSSRFRLACALGLNPADRLTLRLDQMGWSTAVDTVTAVLPSDSCVEHLSVIRSKHSPYIPSHIRLQAKFYGRKFLDIRLYKPRPRSGDRWSMALSIAQGYRGLDTAFWDEFVDRFLPLTQHEPLPVHVAIGNYEDSEGIINRIVQGHILAKAAAEEKLLLRRCINEYDGEDVWDDSGRPRQKAVTKDAILSAPSDRTVDGLAIKLTPFERFWLLTRENTEDECLHELMVRRRTAEYKAQQEAEETERREYLSKALSERSPSDDVSQICIEHGFRLRAPPIIERSYEWSSPPSTPPHSTANGRFDAEEYAPFDEDRDEVVPAYTDGRFENQEVDASVLPPSRRYDIDRSLSHPHSPANVPSPSEPRPPLQPSTTDSITQTEISDQLMALRIDSDSEEDAQCG